MYSRICIAPLICIVLCLTQVDTVMGDTYKTELSLDYSDADSPAAKSEVRGFGVNYHLTPVDDSKGPLAQAAFVTRASHVYLNYAKSDTKIRPPRFSFGEFPSGIEFNPSIIGLIDGNFVPATIIPPENGVAISRPFGVTPSTKMNIYSGGFSYMFNRDLLVAGGLELSDGDSDFLFTKSTVEGFGLNIQVGKYIRPTTTVTLGFSDKQVDTKRHTDVRSCPFPPYCFLPLSIEEVTESTRQEWKVQGKHLQAGASVHHAFTGELAYQYHDTNIRIDSMDILQRDPRLKSYGLITRLGYTVYPTSKIGLGVGFNYLDAEASSTSSSSFALDWFVTNYLSLRVNFINNSADLSGVETDLFGAKLIGRF